MDTSIRIVDSMVLAGDKYNLRRITFEHTNKQGQPVTRTRFVFDRGNGAAILLYDRSAGTVILTRQFRLPAWLAANAPGTDDARGTSDATGMLVEVCAGELDQDAPETAARREAEEETGFRVGDVVKVFESYMSPGAATEIIHFFIAEYSAAMKTGEGGGLETEQEEIEVLEMPFAEAMRMVRTGEIKDAKTIMLLLYARGEGLL
ncbi:MAG TPA: NUDIX domain-containing protein [Puia sp.]|jgi:nudix-type nucleoside diphosphatase (YffH/AdpP family)|nr:NUDIX domain-containing protein [Puia sp.]